MENQSLKKKKVRLKILRPALGTWLYMPKKLRVLYYSAQAPIWDSPGTPECLRDQLSQPLKSRGFHYLADLKTGTTLVSWEVLSNCTQGQLTIFNYYQLGSWCATQDWAGEEEDVKFNQVMRVDRWEKEVSFWYWTFLEADEKIEDEISKLWTDGLEEGELKQMWLDSFCILKTVVKPVSLRRNHLFTTYRVYWSPAKLSKVTGNIYNCPRCGLTSADDLHMFMSRPKIALYWTLVWDFLGEVMGIQIKVSPCLVFFGLIQEEGVQRSSPLSKFIFYVVLLARREICRLWKCEGPPILCRVP